MTGALRAGLRLGLAIAAVEVWLDAARLARVGLRAPLGVVMSGAAMTLALGAAVGIATIGAARRGERWHGLAMTIVWIALQVYAAPPDANGRLLALAMPLGGLALVAAGRAIARRAPLLPPVLGAALLVAGVAAPELAARRQAMPIPVAPPRAPAPPGARDVLVVVLDGVRADHLGAYGYARPTSPGFDALAREGTLFTDAVAPATWSLPSHASLFTGRYASAHGAHDEHAVLDGAMPTLAERFAAAGWTTRAYGADPWVTDAHGTTRGFAWTDEGWRRGDVARTLQSTYRLLDRLGLGGDDEGGAEAADGLARWIVARPAGDGPAFALVDFVDAGLPSHRLPAEYLGRFTTRSRRELRDVGTQLALAAFGGASPVGPDAIEQATAMYDAGIAHADALLGQVVDALRRAGRLDRTIVVVLADHGELLGEHGELGHGRSLYEPVLHVPLLVRFPGRVPAGRRVDTPVSTVGVYATLLDLAGLPAEPGVQVGSLVPVIGGAPHPGPVMAEQFRTALGARAADDPLLRPDARLRAYRSGRWKLVDAVPGGTFFFELGGDPGETRDLSMERRLVLATVREELVEWTERLGIPDLAARVGAKAPLDPAARERLRRLGYEE